MFERAHHQRIESVLRSLDGDLLATHHCLFGGGTAIVLRYGEYRESVDIDFLVSDRDGYRALRQRITGPEGLRALARRPQDLDAPDAPRADQYGLRGVVRAGGASIKFEIVLEARIAHAPPTDTDWLCGVPALTPLDMAASKLLANADRWADDSVFSRDLIDLAMMAPDRALLNASTAKAAEAYGDAVSRDLAAAIARLRERPARLEACMRALKMDRVPKALLWSRIRRLRPHAATGGNRKPA